MQKTEIVKAFEKSIQTRKERSDDSNQIIGTELRLNRHKFELTLKNISDQVCSISYASKIETNGIEAKPEYLNELCQKVNISKDDIEKLKSTRDTQNKLIDAIFVSDKEMICQIYEDIKQYKNFRHLIIDLYYFYYTKEYREFERISKKISQILSTLADIDLNLYGYILAIYDVEKGNIDEAIKLLEQLDGYNVDNLKLELIINFELSKLYFRYNSIKFFKSKDKVLELSNKISNVLYMQKIFDLSKLFFVQNETINQLFNLYFDINNCESSLYKNLNLLKDSITTYNVFYNYFINDCDFVDNDMYKLDEYFLDYMRLKKVDIDKAIDYILNFSLPVSFKECNEFYITFYTCELENHYKENTRYKRYFEVETDYKVYLANKYR